MKTTLALAAFLFVASLTYALHSKAKQAATAPAVKPALPTRVETATLAAGCFWGVEEFYRKLPGVIDVKVGYTGGKTQNPKYDQMHDGKTGHAEAAEIKFDPAKITYAQLLEKFFLFHDPTTKDRQGNDVGNQYRSAIFAHGEEQMKQALAFKAKVEKSGAWKKPIVTEIVPASKFWDAEEEHQDYLVKNPGGYDNHYVRNLKFD